MAAKTGPKSHGPEVADSHDLIRVQGILFSRLGQPHIGSPQSFSFNVASSSLRRS